MDKDIKTEIDLISHILTGGNHLASFLIGKGCFPNSYKSYEEVMALYGIDVADAWVAWRAIMDLSEYFRKEDQ